MQEVEAFQTSLMKRLLDDRLPSNLATEADLERRFVLPLVSDLHANFRNLHVYAHPWKQSAICIPNCTEGAGLITIPQPHGCPDCWKRSKSWAAVRLYGVHCFDLIVGTKGDSFALELKLLHRTGKGNRMANGSFQRFLGQCALARLVHSSVVGFCVAEKGALDMSEKDHLERLRDQGISIIVRES